MSLYTATYVNIYAHHNLSKLNTFGLTSSAKAMIFYQSRRQLSDISALLNQFESHWVLGGGSNVVLAPHINGLTIKVDSKGIRLASETEDHWVVEAEAGECWHDFVRYTIGQGWFGLENLALIPGTVGAAPVQNIGAYGVELDQRLHSVLAWNLRESTLHELTPDECGFAYRDSRFKQAPPGTWLIVAVRFLLPKQWQPVLRYPDLQSHPLLAHAPTPMDVFSAVVEIRQRKLPDPALIGNAGSFFKNPVVDTAVLEHIRQQHPDVTAYKQPDGRYKLAAAWLIDKAGWRAKTVGSVAMHNTQALVMTNLGGATAHDVDTLASLIKTDIQQCFKVRLEQEPIAVS
ncbi:UDP-N-acetylmuramate dehydrogenase [Paenalcaligenes niemegkensis]|uniref:UDP-N-acetylmuramate dehydrogenase n=1 Tax=Paenalcaligenes niemegkensis TaxID=2895469 RepID=UPI001EE7E1B2|nr:UDP-N-acetylmuramate dehydrogenase [Paenalcaligenes niemegkensis]MCQ9617022.1 UDP-N-acetylmuramate dehydrogenase [Paenalcaligenes niemegkensis]